MQITSTTLRQIIKEELDAVMNEDRAEHVAGIEAKIKRLEAEIERAQERRDEIGYDPAADDPRTSKTYRELGVRIENMEDKLDTLRQQREELGAMEESLDEVGLAPAMYQALKAKGQLPPGARIDFRKGMPQKKAAAPQAQKQAPAQAQKQAPAKVFLPAIIQNLQGKVGKTAAGIILDKFKGDDRLLQMLGMALSAKK